jgi:hypothetical protein
MNIDETNVSMKKINENIASFTVKTSVNAKKKG